MTAWMKGLVLLTLMVGGQAGAEVETVTYLHTDHLGSPIMGRDASGNAVFREEYGPWGQQLSATTPSDDVTYTGHANEGDIGLTYMKARWYDPAVGRFLSPDPVTFDGGGAGHLNRYVYAGNSPYVSVDPDGQVLETAWDVANVAMGVAAFSANASQGNWGAAALDGVGVVLDSIGAATPFVPAGAGALIKAGRGVDNAVDLARGANKAPDFVVSSGGTAFPVPRGAEGPTSVINPGGKQTGSAFTGGAGGANGQVDSMRIMDPVPPRGNSPGYPNGYVKYENGSGQGVDPYTGQTLSNKESHFPLD